ncbi:MAG TPA: hypothetical protein VGF84_24105, partial [Micromonosporaceae bacterium]
MDSRLRALCDLFVPLVREYVGRHEYDGVLQDLSIPGVRTALDRLGGPADPDPHDEAQLRAFEDAARVMYDELEMHRSNPLFHIANLDLACYEREYAPAADRERARAAHVEQWPDAIDAAVSTLDRVPAPIAAATVGAARGLASALHAHERAAADAHQRLVSHLAEQAHTGPRETALGGPALARLLGAGEALDVDLAELSKRADAERD